MYFVQENFNVEVFAMPSQMDSLMLTMTLPQMFSSESKTNTHTHTQSQNSN